MIRYLLVSIAALLVCGGAFAQPTAAADTLAGVDSARADSARPAPAVAGPVRGVTWRAPGSGVRADLRSVREAGFTAVRTAAPVADVALDEADRLGLAVYAELPLDYATASKLAETTPAMLRQIAELGTLARRHPSLTHVGVSRRPAAFDPRVCARLRGLAEAVRRAHLVPYVVVDARDPGACSGVGAVFVETSGVAATAPSGGWIVGVPVLPERQGVEHVGSPEQQARTLADALRTDSPVFARQWRDGDDLGGDNPRRLHYGLLDGDGKPRLALNVAAEVLHGRRDGFVYPGGGEPARPSSAPTVWLWVALALVGGVFAAETRLQAIAGRFFRSPTFFRDSVRDARGTMVGATLGQWVALSLVEGVFVAALLGASSRLPVVDALLAGLPRAVGPGLAALMQRPALLVLFVAVLFAVLTGLWAYAFVLAARRRYHLSLWQAVMLIVWHRWAMLPLAVAALVVLGAGASTTTLALFALAFAAIEGWGALRSTLDLVLMTRLPAWVGVLLFLIPPLLALGAALLVFGADERALLAHLAALG